MTDAPAFPAAIALVDDHPLLREGMAALIEEEADLSVQAEAGTLAEGRDLLGRGGTDLDLVILDLTLPDGNGLELLKDIRSRELQIKVLVLTRHEQALYGVRALQAGAQGFLQKGLDPDEIVEAAREVLGGKIIVPNGLKEQALQHLSRTGTGPQHPLSALSDRELEVLELLGRGKTGAEIAEDLHISPKTVYTYFGRIKEKLDLETPSALARYATRFIEGSPPDS